MKKAHTIIAAALLAAAALVVAAPAEAVKVRAFTSPIGSGTGAMDKVSRTLLVDGDIGLVVQGYRLSVYQYCAACTDAESTSAPYRFVRPDDYAGAGVWRLAESWPTRHDQAVASGDLLYFDGTKWARIPLGTAGQVLSVVSGAPAWDDFSGGSFDPSGTDITWGVNTDSTHTWTWDTGAGTDPSLDISDSGFAFNKTLTAPGVASSASDGGHYVNASNSEDYTGTKAEGDLWWNRTDDVLKAYDGAASVVIAKKTQILFSLCIASPADTHDKIKQKMPRAGTITAVYAKCEGGTNVVGRLYEVDADGDDSDKVGIDSSDWTITTSQFSDTSFSNPDYDAGDWLQWDTTSVSGSVTSFCLTVWGYER